MEAHVSEGVQVSRKDVARVQRAILAGKSREQVFPRLGVLDTDVAGEGLKVVVRFSKTKGAPVRLVAAGDETEVATIREVDLQRKYHWAPLELAEKLRLSGPRALALRRYLRIDHDPACRHDFVFGSQKHMRFSDNAFTRMRDALEEVDMGEIWEKYGGGSARAGTS